MSKVRIEMLETTEIPPVGKSGRKWRFPFDRLEINQGFRVHNITHRSISPYICYAQRTLGRKFTVRAFRGGVEVYRVS